MVFTKDKLILFDNVSTEDLADYLTTDILSNVDRFMT